MDRNVTVSVIYCCPRRECLFVNIISKRPLQQQEESSKFMLSPKFMVIYRMEEFFFRSTTSHQIAT